jgi:hypothetical protein
MKQHICIAVTALAMVSATAAAAAGDFDGSKRLICAPVEARDCQLGTACVTGEPEELGAPAFMRIDFDKRVIVGKERTSSIRFMENKDNQLLLQGNEFDFGWTLALDQTTGKMSVALVNRHGAFLMFGSCTPL